MQTLTSIDNRITNPYFYPEDDKRHPRLLMTGTFVIDGKSIHCEIAPYYDLHDKVCYNDDTKLKLFSKFVCLTVVAPVKIAVKWAFHLSLLGIICEIGKTLAYEIDRALGSQNFNVTSDLNFSNCTWNTLHTRCIREVFDMVRTPIGGATLCLIALIAIIKAPFSPVSLYDSRVAFHKCEINLNWGKKNSFWTVAMCFKSYDIFSEGKKDYPSAKQNCLDKTMHYKYQTAGPFDICENLSYKFRSDLTFYSTIIPRNLRSAS